MGFKKTLFIFAGLAILAACSGPERKAAEAQETAAEAEEAVSEKRLKLIDEYEDCMEEAAGDQAKQSSCEQFLKAADALK